MRFAAVRRIEFATHRRPGWLALGVAAFLVALAATGSAMPVNALGGAARASDGYDAYTPRFRVASFNVLGASHTAPDGDRPRFDTYEVRMARTLQLIERQSLDVVGLQEFQRPQYEYWKAAVGSSWAAFPGLTLGTQAVQNSIIWRTDRWELLESHTVEIPYFEGRLIKIPYVKLGDRTTGRAVWFVNTHNASDKKGDAQRWRNRAIRIQAELFNRLQLGRAPVVFTGDLNDRERAFCRLTKFTNLESANGGGWLDGRCAPPQRMPVDWIFHSQTLDAAGYTILDNDLVDAITDHFVIISDLAFPLPG